MRPAPRSRPRWWPTTPASAATASRASRSRSPSWSAGASRSMPPASGPPSTTTCAGAAPTRASSAPPWRRSAPRRREAVLPEVHAADVPVRPPSEARRLGSLAGVPDLDRWVRIVAPDRVEVQTGKVELGQGILTALLAVAADELGVDPARIDLVSGVTGTTPNEWVTAGSGSIEQSAMAVRQACAHARRVLVARAADGARPGPGRPGGRGRGGRGPGRPPGVVRGPRRRPSLRRGGRRCGRSRARGRAALDRPGPAPGRPAGQGARRAGVPPRPGAAGHALRPGGAPAPPRRPPGRPGPGGGGRGRRGPQRRASWRWWPTGRRTRCGPRRRWRRRPAGTAATTWSRARPVRPTWWPSPPGPPRWWTAPPWTVPSAPPPTTASAACAPPTPARSCSTGRSARRWRWPSSPTAAWRCGATARASSCCAWHWPRCCASTPAPSPSPTCRGRAATATTAPTTWLWTPPWWRWPIRAGPCRWRGRGPTSTPGSPRPRPWP